MRSSSPVDRFDETMMAVPVRERAGPSWYVDAGVSVGVVDEIMATMGNTKLPQRLVYYSSF